MYYLTHRNGSQGNNSVTTTEKRDEEFRMKRVLNAPYSKTFHLWALATGAVISGNFTGWNLGLATGFGGLLFATLIITSMYWALTFSLAEMSAALPFSGGQATFMMTAFGPFAGSLLGYFCMIEFLLASTQLLVACGAYITYAFQTDVTLEPVWWIPLLAMAIILNTRLPMFYKATISITILSCISILVYLISVVGKTQNFNFNLLSKNDTMDDLGKTDIMSVIASIPSAIWFFLGIEVLPTSAEETVNPRRDIQRGLIWSMSTLSLFAISILLLCPGSAPGTYVISKSVYPLLDSLSLNLNLNMKSTGGIALSVLFYSGLLASLLTLIFGFTRYFYALSRGGFLPTILSITQKGNPIYTLLFGCVAIYLIALIIFLTPGTPVAVFLLNASVMYALLSYIGSFVAYIGLRIKIPHLSRPFKSPVGIPGAIFGIIICLMAIVSCCIFTEIFRTVFWFIGAQTILTIPYYIFYGRHALRLTPERLFVKNQLQKVAEQDNQHKKAMKSIHFVYNSHQRASRNASLMNLSVDRIPNV